MKFSTEELSKLRVTDLRGLVRQHNLHNAIRKYSSMRKNELVEQLVKHKGGQTIKIKLPKEAIDHIEHHEEMDHRSPTPETPPKRAHKPVKKDVEVTKKPKKAKRHSKPKQTDFDKAFGVHDPLYSKIEGGLVEGAKKQFEKRWADETRGDAAFLKNLQKKMQKQDENKKRKRVAKKSDAYEYPSLRKESRTGRGKRKKLPNKKYM